MENIEYGKKYSLEGWSPGSEAVYLGRKLKTSGLHMFIVGPPSSATDYNPWLIGCVEFKINENKLRTYKTKFDSFEINKLEKEYLKELAKKYWG